MIIDLNKLKREGKTESEFVFDYVPSSDKLGLPFAEYDGAVKVTAFVELSGRDVFADVTLSYVIKGACSRCLEPARQKIDYSFEAKFSLNPNLDDEEYGYSGGKVDLTDCVNENLILSAPAAIYCKPDCKGLCPVCGANRNLTDCGHND